MNETHKHTTQGKCKALWKWCRGTAKATKETTKQSTTKITAF